VAQTDILRYLERPGKLVFFSIATKRLKVRSGCGVHRLEALLRDLCLGVGDGLGAVGVNEAAASLAVLELGSVARADADGVALGVGSTTGTAALGAVGVRNAATGRELLARAVADVTSTRVVGGQGNGAESDFSSESC
jgi:hypothetical protein